MFEPLSRFLVKIQYVPKADAEELAQDVLFKVHSNIRKFRNNKKAKFTTWIFEIAKNCAIDFHRLRLQRAPELTENSGPVSRHDQFAGRNTPWLAWLRDELEKLPAVDQQILLWRADEIPNAEIGEWLGINAGAVRTRYCRAKKRLLAADNQPEIPGEFTGQDISEAGVVHE